MDVGEPTTFGGFISNESSMMVPSEKGLNDGHSNDRCAKKVVFG